MTIQNKTLYCVRTKEEDEWFRIKAKEQGFEWVSGNDLETLTYFSIVLRPYYYMVSPDYYNRICGSRPRDRLDYEVVEVKNLIKEEKENMNWKNYCVEADTYEEALRKWQMGETVAHEEKEQEVTKEDYTVKVEGNKTIVTTADGKVGIARCNPEDKFDIVEGIRIALEDIKKKYRKLTNEELAIIKYLEAMGCTELNLCAIDGLEYIRGSRPEVCDVLAGVVRQHNEFHGSDERKWYSIKELLERNK